MDNKLQPQRRQQPSQPCRKEPSSNHRDELRRHAPSPAPSDDRGQLTPHEMKRRAQNRASQRAFRERKRTHTENLQHEVNERQQKYDELRQAHQHKEEELSALHARMHDLEHTIQILKRSHAPLQAPPSSALLQFEPVLLDESLDRWSSPLFQTPSAWETQLQQTYSFDGLSSTR